jgi:WD40 repeat protein
VLAWAFTLLLIVCAASVHAADERKPVSFKNEVAPILARNCLACHGPSDPKGDYQLHTFEALLKPGESEDASVTPGKIDKSYLYALVSSTSESDRMPKDADPLPRREIETIRRWIAEGAKFDGGDKTALLTTMLPKRVHPSAPESYRAPIAVTALAFSPDGKELAVSGYHEITIWNAEDGKLLRRIGKVDERVYALDWRADGKLLAAATGTPGQSGEVALYEPTSGKVVRTLYSAPDVALGVAFSPDGKRLATAGADRSIRIFDVESGKQQKLIEDHADWVTSITWNHAGTQLASSGRDKVSKIFDVKTGEAVASYSGHDEAVFTVAFKADDKLVVSGGADKRVHFWNPADGKQKEVVKGFGEVFKLVLDGKRLFIGGSDKTVHEYNADDMKKEVRPFTGHSDYVFAVAFNAKAKRLAAGSYDGQVRIWNSDDGKPVTNFVASPGYVSSATASKK